MKALLSENKKVLVFSHSLVMLSLIEQQVKGDIGCGCLRLDGSTSTSSRQTLVDKFNQNDEYKVFLVSAKAGGTYVYEEIREYVNT